MGSGSVLMPSLPPPRPLRITMTSPTRKTSLYDVKGPTMTSDDGKKRHLLRRTVRAEELRDIVSRLTRPTASSQQRSHRVRPKVDYIDMNTYQWSTVHVYADYQRQMFSPTGAVKTTFRKCGGRRGASLLGRSYV